MSAVIGDALRYLRRRCGRASSSMGRRGSLLMLVFSGHTTPLYLSTQKYLVPDISSKAFILRIFEEFRRIEELTLEPGLAWTHLKAIELPWDSLVGQTLPTRKLFLDYLCPTQDILPSHFSAVFPYLTSLSLWNSPVPVFGNYTLPSTLTQLSVGGRRRRNIQTTALKVIRALQDLPHLRTFKWYTAYRIAPLATAERRTVQLAKLTYLDLSGCGHGFIQVPQSLSTPALTDLHMSLYVERESDIDAEITSVFAALRSKLAVVVKLCRSNAISVATSVAQRGIDISISVGHLDEKTLNESNSVPTWDGLSGETLAISIENRAGTIFAGDILQSVHRLLHGALPEDLCISMRFSIIIYRESECPTRNAYPFSFESLATMNSLETVEINIEDSWRQQPDFSLDPFLQLLITSSKESSPSYSLPKLRLIVFRSHTFDSHSLQMLHNTLRTRSSNGAPRLHIHFERCKGPCTEERYKRICSLQRYATVKSHGWYINKRYRRGPDDSHLPENDDPVVPGDEDTGATDDVGSLQEVDG